MTLPIRLLLPSQVSQEDFPDQLIGFAIEDFELADEAEFYDYFGYCLLNVSHDYTNTGFEISLFIAIIALVILLIMGIVALAKISKKKSAIRRMEASGELDRVAREMRSPDSVTLENGSAKLIMTENYFISNDGNIIRLSDILWCYRQIRKINGISYNAGLVLACKNKKHTSYSAPYRAKARKQRFLKSLTPCTNAYLTCLSVIHAKIGLSISSGSIMLAFNLR